MLRALGARRRLLEGPSLALRVWAGLGRGEVGPESLWLGLRAQTCCWNPSWARDLWGSYSPE